MGPEFIYKTLDKVHIMWNRLKTTFIWQMSYADHNRRELKFKNGDKVYLKILLMKGVVMFVKKGKISLSYLGLFEI